MTTVRYYIPDNDMTVDDAWELPGSVFDDAHQSYIASDCADDYHGSHDGWEHKNWPTKFVIVDDDGKESTWEIYRDIAPVWTAVEVPATLTVELEVKDA